MRRKRKGPQSGNSVAMSVKCSCKTLMRHRNDIIKQRFNLLSGGEF